MANTGFFGRLSNLWRGFVSLWISDVEKKHPEIAYENAINSMIEKYTALKHATAAIIRRREDIDARFKQKSGELAQVSADLQTAVDGNSSTEPINERDQEVLTDILKRYGKFTKENSDDETNDD